MHNPEDANAALAEELVEILMRAHALGLTRTQVTMLCYACGIDRRLVLPRWYEQRSNETRNSQTKG